MRSLAFSINLFLMLAAASLLSGTCMAADTADTENSDFVAIPPVAQVTDLTNTLTGEVQNKLKTDLAALEKEKGAQVVVLILPSTGPEDIAAYSMRVFDAWKLGRKGVDDGVIILVAKNDHHMRIAVGRGLEGAIPDVYAKRIVSDIMAPAFKENDFAGGISKAVDAVSKLVRGESLPAPTARAADSGSLGEVAIIGGAFIGVFLVYGLLYWLTTEWVAINLTSILSGVAAGGFSSSIIIGLGVGLGVALLLWFIGRMIDSDGGGSFIGEMFSSDSGGGSASSSSSSSSDDSFSGGGGDSAGGGASGSW